MTESRANSPSCGQTEGSRPFLQHLARLNDCFYIVPIVHPSPSRGRTDTRDASKMQMVHSVVGDTRRRRLGRRRCAHRRGGRTHCRVQSHLTYSVPD
jgi:hypothetical protein